MFSARPVASAKGQTDLRVRMKETGDKVRSSNGRRRRERGEKKLDESN